MRGQNQKLIRSFGRIKSRKLSDSKQELLDKDLKNYEIEDSDNILASNYSKFHLKSFEIGFGFGDFTAYKAKKNPNSIFFASEPHINGVVNLVSLIKKDALQNIKVSMEDARILLEKFEDEFFDNIFILFPDPWPKLRHFKRRIITARFLDESLSKKLKKGSELLIATDHDSYKTWICREALKLKNFSWQCEEKKDWQDFPDDWIETKYQKKAKKEGRVSVIFRFKRM